MQGSSGIARGLAYLVAGAALGAGVVLVLWMLSGGKPFGEVIGTGPVSSPTTASVQRTDVQQRTDAPAANRATLENAPPALGGTSELKFSTKSAAKRRVKAKRAAKATPRKPRRARKPVVRVVAPPPAEPAEEVPVAAVPSPAPPTAAPAPAAPAPSGGGGKPVKRNAPALSVGAGEG